MRYETLDLRITRQGPSSLMVWADWALGHGSDQVPLDLSDLAPELEAMVAGRADRERVKAFGTLLFDRLFRSEDGDVGEQLNQCWGAAKKDRLRGIRIRLRFDDPSVGSVPWELLYWPTRDTYFAASPQTALERYLEVPDLIRQPQVRPPISVLVVCPAVQDLDTETEVENLFRVMDGLDHVEAVLLDGEVTAARVRATLDTRDFQILHFIGHGGVDEQGPFLVLADSGPEATLDDQQLAHVLGAHEPLQLVVLNSCQGAEGSPEGLFVGMAQRLVSRGLPAVLAMQYSIYDKVAHRFSLTFYRTLLTGRARGDVEIATTAARTALATDFPDTVAFATPVLFLRTADGVLFDLVSGSFARDVPLGIDRAQALKSVERTVEQNLKLRLEQAGADPSTEEAERIAADRAALARIRRRLRTGTVLGLVPLLVAAVVFITSWLYVLDRFSRWARLETLTVRVAELFDSTPLDDGLALVVIDSTDVDREDEEFGSAWRPRMAELVDRISAARPRVIALDLTLNGDTDADSVLARSFENASARGIPVIIAVDRMRDETVQVARLLRPHIEPGVACATTGARFVADLLVVKPGTERVLSYPLLAALAYRDQTLADVDLVQERLVFERAGTREVFTFAASERIAAQQSACPLLMENDTVVSMAVDYSDPGALRHSGRRFSFTEIVHSTALPDQLEDKLVVVGVEPADVVAPLYPGLGGEQRFGFEFMTDAINTLLSRKQIRPLGAAPLFLLILLAAVAGAMTAILPRNANLWHRALGLTALSLALFLGAVQAYRAAGLMIMVAYPCLALLLGFWGARTLRRWRLT